VVRRVKAERGQVAERRGEPALVARAQGVAVVLDQPQAMAVAEFPHLAHGVGHAHGMGDHHRLGFRTERRLDLVEVWNVSASFSSK
jgi:hypothetical protein